MLRIILPFSSPDLGYSEAGAQGRGQCGMWHPRGTPWPHRCPGRSAVRRQHALPLEHFLSSKGCGCWSWKHSKITVLMIREGGMNGWLPERGGFAAGCWIWECLTGSGQHRPFKSTVLSWDPSSACYVTLSKLLNPSRGRTNSFQNRNLIPRFSRSSLNNVSLSV